MVLVLKDQPNLGLIREVLSPRRVVVRHKNRGANTDHQYHCKILALLFRPTSSVFFISTFEQNKPEMGHLLEAFWSRLKQQITWNQHYSQGVLLFIPGMDQFPEYPLKHYLRQLWQLPPLVISSTAGCILTPVIISLIKVITCQLTPLESNF